MNKLFSIGAFSALFLLSACSQQTSEKPIFTGYWQGSDQDVFEVFKTAPDSNDYTIRNVFGDLHASLEGDSVLKGMNSEQMPIAMRVRGDSAYYEFANIISGYKRIDSTTYKALSAKQAPIPAEPKVEVEIK